MFAAALATVVDVAILAPAALGQAPAPTAAARNPSDWCRPERGYFIDQRFVSRPPTDTRPQIMAAPALGDNARANQMVDANYRATQPIEMRFGAGTLRINSSNYYDQFYIPTTCAKSKWSAWRGRQQAAGAVPRLQSEDFEKAHVCPHCRRQTVPTYWLRARRAPLPQRDDATTHFRQVSAWGQAVEPWQSALGCLDPCT